MKYLKNHYTKDDIHQLVTYYMFNDSLDNYLIKNDLEELKLILEEIYTAYTIIDIHGFLSFQEYSSHFNDLVNEISILLLKDGNRERLNKALGEEDNESI